MIISKRFTDLRKSKKDKYGKDMPVLQLARELLENQCIINYKADVIRQEISKVEKEGKVPQLFLIAGYSKYFSVTSDYLLGLRNTKTIDENTAMIGKVTGLSDIAISKLKNASIFEQTLVNKLISTTAINKIEMAYTVLNSRFFRKMEIYDDAIGNIPLSDEECKNYHQYQAVEFLKSALDILNNDEELFGIINNNHSESVKQRFWRIAIDMEIDSIGIDKTLEHITDDSKIIPKEIIEYVKQKKEGVKSETT